VEVWSGGQTGVDRAALDVARSLGFPTGGWIPRGRLAEDGIVPEAYDTLREAESDGYPERTRLNVRDTDATLVLNWGPPGGGTLETITCAEQEGRPLLAIDLAADDYLSEAGRIISWIQRVRPGRLNVAGPRASKAPGVYPRAHALLVEVLSL
jgi:hypothetical protein